MRGLIGHIVVLLVASGLALNAWTSEEQPLAEEGERVQVWGGQPDQVQSIGFEGEKSKVELVAKKDEQGTWFVATSNREVTPPRKRPPNLHGGADEEPNKSEAEPKPKRETKRFVAVTAAGKLLESVAPLMALRAVGKIDKKRDKEFGFDKPEGTLKVKIAGQEHALVIGGATPGGADRYARTGSGEVYAVPGNMVQDLDYADSRLLERDLHGFAPDAVHRVRIDSSGKQRELLRLEGKLEGWADIAAPEKQDETAGNWMTKLGRLHVLEYVEKLKKPASPGDTVVRVDYYDENRRPLGFLELIKLAGEGGEAEYYAHTEHSRWYVKLLKSAAEPLEQDLSSVVK